MIAQCAPNCEITGKKDPNAPKWSKSGYVFFCAASRAEIVESLPADHLPTDVPKALGKAWKALGAKKKAPFEALAATDKARYATEMESYTPPAAEEGAEEAAEGGKKKKRKLGRLTK